MSVIKYIKHNAWMLLSGRPNILPLIHKITEKRHGRYCSESTDMCIEGFPSSANSFTYNIFKEVGDNLNIAHHTHSIANVKRSIIFGIPTIILYRHPREAISSKCVRFGSSPRYTCLRYCNFYSYILDNHNRFFLLSFSDATEKIEESIHNFESFSGLNFRIGGIKDAKQKVSKHIKKWSKNKRNNKNISLPSKERNEKKKEIINRLEGENYYSDSIDLYRDMKKTDKRNG